MCSKHDFKNQDLEAKRQKGPGGDLMSTTEANKQLVGMAKAIVRIDYHNPPTMGTPTPTQNNFRIVVHNNVIPQTDTETSFKEIDAYFDISQIDFEYTHPGGPTLSYYGDYFGLAVEDEDGIESYDPITNINANSTLPDLKAIEDKFQFKPDGASLPVDAWNMYQVPQKGMSTPFETTDKYSLPMLVVPIVSKGYYSTTNPDEIRGYWYDPAAGGGVTAKTYPSQDVFEDTEIELKGDADNLPNYYIVYIYIRTDNSGSTEPQVDCQNVEARCGDETCDKYLGCINNYTEDNNCPDCLPNKKRVLRLDGVKVLTDQKGTNAYNEKWSYRESYMSGKYEIAAKYLIVKNNGTKIHGYAYCNNSLGEPTKFFGSSSEVVRERIDQGVHEYYNNGVATYKTDVKILTDNFNPATDKIYIMFFELDRDWIGGDPQYKYSVLKSVNNRSLGLPFNLTTFEFKYRSTDPPFGNKYHRFDHTNSYHHQDINSMHSLHIYELDASNFTLNSSSGKWEFNNSNATFPVNNANQYGLEFQLNYDN